ncbi:MAG: PD-(D/E)XK nuclease family protein [Candidatus Korarchaeota archaeon]|nr:PD-(D/E)XK nuclease family protein [Candidatus Korarchaeota archaeon]
MTDEPHLSVTQLRMYLRCPLQYYFRYICGLKIPPTGDITLGRTVHAALEENYRQKVETHRDLPLEQVYDIFSERWDEEAQLTLFQEDEKPGRLKDEGIRLLSTYHTNVAPKVQPVSVEQEFLIDTGVTQLPLKGYIDLIDDQGTIIDHKTTKRSYPQDAAEKDLQLTAYALAYRALHGHPERALRLDVLVRTKQPKIQHLEATRTEADIDRFLRLAEQVERAITTGIFYPNENFMCGICGYRDLCTAW